MKQVKNAICTHQGLAGTFPLPPAGQQLTLRNDLSQNLHPRRSHRRNRDSHFIMRAKSPRTGQKQRSLATPKLEKTVRGARGNPATGVTLGLGMACSLEMAAREPGTGVVITPGSRAVFEDRTLLFRFNRSGRFATVHRDERPQRALKNGEECPSSSFPLPFARGRQRKPVMVLAGKRWLKNSIQNGD